jgi:hypothetical protein
VKVLTLFDAVFVVVVRQAVKHGVRDPAEPEQKYPTKQNSTH